MKIGKYNFEAEWLRDCGGKQDFDFGILKVDTRMWRDNSFSACIVLGEEPLIESEIIYCDSEIECKYKAEQWIKENVEKIICKILR